MKWVFLILIIASNGWALDRTANLKDALSQYQKTRGAAARGVRGVGNGGGAGEMRAYLANHQLPVYVQACVQNPSWCELTQAEAQTVKNASETEFTIEIVPGCLETPLNRIEIHQAQISSCALYEISVPEQAPHVRKYSDILTWVLTARLRAIGVSMEDAFGISTQVFRGTQESEDSVYLSGTTGNVTVSSLEVQLGSGQSFSVLSLEGKTKTVETGHLLEAQLACPSGQLVSWNAHNLIGQVDGTGEAVVEADLQWKCSEGAAQIAQMQLFFKVSDSEVAPGPSVRVFGRRL
jgi:hypothetical protein